MNRIMKRWASALLGAAALVIMPFGGITSWAATAEISFSDPSAMVGNEVNVSMKVSTGDGALGGADITLTYDPSVLEFVGGDNANGGAGTIRLIGTMDSDNTTSFSYNLKFKTLQAGNTSISVGGYEIYDKDTQAVSVSHVGGSTVKVTPPATYSSEAALASLTISPGGLSPAFSADVTSYTASVGGDVEKIAVSAVAKDGKAKVVTSGSSNLKTGQNKVTCKVTAEDGQTVKTYTITVTKAETAETTVAETLPEESAPQETSAITTGDISVEVGGIQYSVVTSFDETILPEGFEATTIDYQGSQIMAGKGIAKALTLVQLAGPEGSGNFYIYDEESKSLTAFVSLDVTEKSIVILPKEEGIEIPGGYVANDAIEVNGHIVQGWVLAGEEKAEYCIFYGMNWNGEKGLYRYDRTEKTIQRFFNDLTDTAIEQTPKYQEVAQKFNSLVDEYDFSRYMIIALIIVSLILFVMTIVLLVKRRGQHGGYGDQDYGMEYQDKRSQEEMTPVRRRMLQREQEAKRQPLEMEDEPMEEEFEPEVNSPVSSGDVESRLAALKENRKALYTEKKDPEPENDPEDDDFEFLDLDE